MITQPRICEGSANLLFIVKYYWFYSKGFRDYGLVHRIIVGFVRTICTLCLALTVSRCVNVLV